MIMVMIDIENKFGGEKNEAWKEVEEEVEELFIGKEGKALLQVSAYWMIDSFRG
jgi:hypothetical protein